MNLRQIEIFRAVMLSGSISDAARLLNVTQPGISRAVKHLEQQLGVRLFQRLKGRLLATEEARQLFERIQQVYKGVQTVQAFAGSLGDGSHSTLRIVCGPSLGLQVVPRVISNLLRRMPSARFEMEVLSSLALVDALVMGHADVGVGAAAIDHPLLRIKRIGQMRMVCVGPREYGLASKAKVSANDVSKLPLISFDTHTTQGQLVARALSKLEPPVAPVVSVRFAHTACSLAAAGVGVAFVDELTAASVAAGNIDILPITPALHIPVFSASPLHRPLGTLAALFMDEVAETFKAALKSPSLEGQRRSAK
ncbi:LysR family transcriptional regulator [Piscinibacter sakaiensis]|uniref:LysR family transcriptional regulator n=1 Tax=Piscinibacter sakaiensis TaxID=1547922 RepID=UPI003AAB14E2